MHASGTGHEILTEFATGALGPGLTFEDRSRTFGRTSVTWRVGTPSGERFYLKQHVEYRLFVTELAVYLDWVPKLPGSELWRNPELVDYSVDLGVLLLTEVPGTVLSEDDSSAAERLQIHRSAGTLAALIHKLNVDTSVAGPARSYDEEMMSGYIERARPYLDASTLSWIEDVFADGDAFGGLPLVPTHSDFSPRNWLIDRSGDRVSLGVIDWERARAGYWLEDAQRLVYGDWQMDPRLRTAFFDGYGRTPDPREERQMKLISLANAIGTVTWATENRDTEFAEFGRSTLDRLKKELGY